MYKYPEARNAVNLSSTVLYNTAFKQPPFFFFFFFWRPDYVAGQFLTPTLNYTHEPFV